MVACHATVLHGFKVLVAIQRFRKLAEKADDDNTEI